MHSFLNNEVYNFAGEREDSGLRESTSDSGLWTDKSHRLKLIAPTPPTNRQRHSRIVRLITAHERLPRPQTHSRPSRPLPNCPSPTQCRLHHHNACLPASPANKPMPYAKKSKSPPASVSRVVLTGRVNCRPMRELYWIRRAGKCGFGRILALESGLWRLVCRGR